MEWDWLARWYSLVDVDVQAASSREEKFWGKTGEWAEVSGAD